MGIKCESNRALTNTREKNHPRVRGGGRWSSERPSVRADSSTKDVTQRLDSLSRSKRGGTSESHSLARAEPVLWRSTAELLSPVNFSWFLTRPGGARRGIAVVVTTHGVSARFRTLIRNVATRTEGLEGPDCSWYTLTRIKGLTNAKTRQNNRFPSSNRERIQ